MAHFSRVRAAGLAAIAVGAALALTVIGLSGRAPARAMQLVSVRTTDFRDRTPPFFASVSGTAGYRFRLELRSTTTGRVTKVLTSLGQSWTNNGFALSPDGRYIYFTLIPRERRWRSLLLERIGTSGGRPQRVGRGEQPALSPDGRLLAFATGAGRSAGVMIRDESTGFQRSINLSRLLGTSNDMLNASLTWAGDGKQLVVFEACCATLDVARPGHRPAPYRTRLLVVSISRTGGLTVRRVRGPAAKETPESAGSDRARPNSVLVAPLIAADRAAVDRLTPGPSKATLTRILTIPRAQVLSFNPTGQRLLYIQGHRPPNLWTATIGKHGLVNRHLLIRSSKLEAVAW